MTLVAFLVAWLAPPALACGLGGPPPDSATAQSPGGVGPTNKLAFSEPVNGSNGGFYYPQVDLAIPARGMPLVVSRVHQTYQAYYGPYGFNADWSWNLVSLLTITGTGTSAYINFCYPDGTQAEFTTSDGVHFVPQSANFASITDTVTLNADNTIDLVTKHQTKYHFIYFNFIQSLGLNYYLLSYIQDRNGNRVTWTYSSSWAITAVTDASGRSLTLNMDPITINTSSNGMLMVRIYSITDWSGRVWSYGNYTNVPYTGWAPATFTTPANQTWTYTYTADTYGLLLTVTDPRGNLAVSNTYLSGGLWVVSQTRANGDTWQYTYTTTPPSGPQADQVTLLRNSVSQGSATSKYSITNPYQLLEFDDALGNKTTWTNQTSPATGWPLSMTDPLSNTWQLTWDTKGNLLTSTDPLNNVWSFQYDPTYNLLTQATSPLNQVWTYGRDSHGNLTSVTDPLGHVTTFTEDAYGETTSVTDANNRKWTFGWDQYGDLTSVQDPLNNSTTYAFDTVGRLLSITDPLGHVVLTQTYDAADRVLTVKDALNNQTAFAWDLANNLTSVTDANNKVTSMQFNNVNQVTGLTNALNGLTQFSYDNRDNLNGVTNALNNSAITSTNNQADLETQENILGDTTNLTYDGGYNLTALQTPTGSTINYTWDKLHRLTLKSFPDGTRVSYSYDGVGRRTQMVDPGGTTTYTWDAANRLTSVNQYGKTITYGYDNSNVLTGITDANGVVTTLNHDSAVRLTSAVRNSQTISFSYDAASRLLQKTLPNGIVENLTWDNANRLTQLQWMNGSTPVGSNSFTYDGVGNRLTESRTWPTGAANLTYTFDSLYRLTQVQNGSTTTGYSFDAVGNRLTKGSTTNTFNTKDQMTSSGGATYAFDANGRLTSKTANNQTTTYAWDYENHLKTITFPNGTTDQFQYDGDGHRVKLVDVGNNAITYVWSGEQVINEFTGSGAAKASYFLTGRSQGSLQPNNVARWNLTDGLGSVNALTDSAATTTDTYAYDEYGLQGVSNGTSYNPYRYAGQKLDGDSGLYFLRARFYDPSQGRFLSRDPIRYNSGQLNPYAYCADNPINLVDPSGLTPLYPAGSPTDPESPTLQNARVTQRFIGNLAIGTVCCLNPYTGVLYIGGTSAYDIYHHGLTWKNTLPLVLMAMGPIIRNLSAADLPVAANVQSLDVMVKTEGNIATANMVDIAKVPGTRADIPAVIDLIKQTAREQGATELNLRGVASTPDAERVVAHFAADGYTVVPPPTMGPDVGITTVIIPLR